MKLFFFIAGFFILFTRVYMGYTQGDKSSRQEVTVTIDDGYTKVQLRYAGKIFLDDSQTSIKRMTPGGYFEYRSNDAQLRVESDLQGEPHYMLGGGKSIRDSSAFVAVAIKFLAEHSRDRKERADDLYKRGGIAALLERVKSADADNIRVMYLDRVISADSATADQAMETLERINELKADHDKTLLLNKVKTDWLEMPIVLFAWFGSVERLHADVDKAGCLRGFIKREGMVSDSVAASVLRISGQLKAESDRRSIEELVNRAKRQ
ncbi:MAG: hypothetical protein JST68_26055 [Bacteroidetes bacterium]|nr:hypothetical protein [Bacteroidota bacterium]